MEPIMDMESDLETIMEHAKNAVLGGRSSLRLPGERSRTCYPDQVTGMLGEAAACRYLLGSIEPWCRRRRLLDRDPMQGDDGHDVPCKLPIDVKSSRMRYSLYPMDYMLPVRPREMRPAWAYLSVMLEMDRPVAHIAGWAISSMFPPPESSGTLAGAHVLPNSALLPPAALAWAVSSMEAP